MTPVGLWPGKRKIIVQLAAEMERLLQSDGPEANSEADCALLRQGSDAPGVVAIGVVL